tara:strand:- start:68 stop:352 length:285 start_codon:yes stop_codon:yes gene_type:complete
MSGYGETGKIGLDLLREDYVGRKFTEDSGLVFEVKGFRTIGDLGGACTGLLVEKVYPSGRTEFRPFGSILGDPEVRSRSFDTVLREQVERVSPR